MYVTFNTYTRSSQDNLCFQRNIATTLFLVSHTCEIRFHDVRGRSSMYYVIGRHNNKLCVLTQEFQSIQNTCASCNHISHMCETRKCVIVILHWKHWLLYDKTTIYVCNIQTLINEVI